MAKVTSISALRPSTPASTGIACGAAATRAIEKTGARPVAALGRSISSTRPSFTPAACATISAWRRAFATASAASLSRIGCGCSTEKPIPLKELMPLSMRLCASAPTFDRSRTRIAIVLDDSKPVASRPVKRPCASRMSSKVGVRLTDWVAISASLMPCAFTASTTAPAVAAVASAAPFAVGRRFVTPSVIVARSGTTSVAA